MDAQPGQSSPDEDKTGFIDFILHHGECHPIKNFTPIQTVTVWSLPIRQPMWIRPYQELGQQLNWYRFQGGHYMHKKRSSEKKRQDLSRETQLKDDSTLSSVRRFENKIRVMLVDDHPGMRYMLRSMLGSESDIEVVIEASDGEKAVHLAREIVPDVILMDINMPNMNGLEATRIIHSEFSHIRIIGLSVYHHEDYQAAAMISAGASAYRSKTDDTAVIVAAIRGELE